MIVSIVAVTVVVGRLNINRSFKVRDCTSLRLPIMMYKTAELYDFKRPERQVRVMIVPLCGTGQFLKRSIYRVIETSVRLPRNTNDIRVFKMVIIHILFLSLFWFCFFQARRVGLASDLFKLLLPFLKRTSNSSTAGIEARIQTGALPAVGWSGLLCLGFVGFALFGQKTNEVLQIDPLNI